VPEDDLPEDDLAARIARLEDRAAISDVVIRYCTAVDRRDWDAFASCFADRVDVDHDDTGRATSTVSREEFVALVAEVLDGFTRTQHLSTNHEFEFGDDPDEAVCHSHMFAQHRLAGSPNGEVFDLRAIYDNRMVRTTQGWRLAGVFTHHRWIEGNEGAVDEARERVRAARGAVSP
jgi:hypothetical protein